MFQKQQICLPLSKNRIWDSMILLSTEVTFIVEIKYPMSRYYHCMIYIYHCVHQLHWGKIFTNVTQNVKFSLYLPFINLKTKTLLSFVLFLVKHYTVRNFYPNRIKLILIYQGWFYLTWNIPCSKNYPDTCNAESKLQKKMFWLIMLIFRCWSKSM